MNDNRPDGQFQKDLQSLLNRYSAEAPSGTPDFILSDFLTGVLRDFNEAVSRRAEWRGEAVDLNVDHIAVADDRPKTPYKKAIDAISENQVEAQKKLQVFLMRSPGFLATMGEDFEVEYGDVDIHMADDHLRNLYDYEIVISQKIRFTQGKTQEIKSEPESRPDVKLEIGGLDNILRKSSEIHCATPSPKDARELMYALGEIFAEQHCFTVADLKTLVGDNPVFTDVSRGWADIVGIHVEGSTLILPKPKFLI